jgi:hypothetical protein
VTAVGRSSVNRRNVHIQNSRPKVVGESESCIQRVTFLCDLVTKGSNMQNVTSALAWSGAAVCAQKGAEEW